MQMGGPVTTLRDNVLRHSSSGTSVEPDSSAPPMLMRMSGKWMEMLHGEANVAEQQQSGPRGRDKLFSVNWVMPMAQRATAHGEWTLVSMLSLEPATVTRRYYPELKILVGDDGFEPSPRTDVGYLRLPEDIGLSAGRNALLDITV